MSRRAVVSWMAVGAAVLMTAADAIALPIGNGGEGTAFALAPRTMIAGDSPLTLGLGDLASTPIAGSSLALRSPFVGTPDGVTVLARDRSMGGSRPPGERMQLLSAARARILLQSLTVPGWGQATLGRRTSSTVFLLAETGVWASFSAFRIQQQLRRQSYELTARLFAGIDLQGRDEEFRRIVGTYPSSEEYNRLVVRRDAANLYFGDPAAYNAYIAEHELGGGDAWAWDSYDNFVRYRQQRQDTQRAGLRAQTALALAVANRLVSAIHAARVAGRPSTTEPRSWNLECVPVGGDPTAFRLGVRARF